MNNEHFYNFNDDLIQYPNAWCYIIIGGRNTGKTYSALKHTLLNDIKHCFLKRTIEDVDLLCSGSGRVGKKENDFGIDLSPYKSINRDMITDVRAYSIKSGIGGFWKHVNGEITGTPIGYLLALSAVQKYKGFDLSECDYLIFDEFIPQPWERINRKEGEQIMDLYKTVSRAREHIGKEPLKLVALANATSINNPLMNILEITDIVANMNILDEEYYYSSDRGILIHRVKSSEEFMDQEKRSPIYKAMSDTAWGQMAFENKFGYNDFTNIKKQNIKGYKAVCRFKYKHRWIYIYRKDGFYYLSNSRHSGSISYDLNLENHQKSFYYDYVRNIKTSCIEGNAAFETYTMYDLIVNYKKFFNI